MSKEIERKFLIRENNRDFIAVKFYDLYSSIEELKEHSFKKGKMVRQGYMPLNQVPRELGSLLKDKIDFEPLEARLRATDSLFYFALKGKGDIEREEAETFISLNLFNKYWPLTLEKRIKKIRLKKRFSDFIFEFDVYLDRDLIVAEVETDSVEKANLVPLIGKDITEDKRYKNKNLAK